MINSILVGLRKPSNPLVIVAFAAIAAMPLSLFSRRIAVRLKCFALPPADNPCHKKGIRYELGGLAVIIAALLVSLAQFDLRPNFYLIIAYLLGMMMVGLLDDIRPLPPAWKFIIQFPLHVGVVMIIRSPFGNQNEFLFYAAAVAWLAIMTNAYNIIDTADGLLPSVAVLSGAAIGCIIWRNGNTETASIVLACAGSSLGFLPGNAFPGKQILGDTGSLPLGAVLSLGVLYACQGNTGDWCLFLLLLIVAFPVFEVIWVSVRRIKRGLRPWRKSPHHFIFWLTEQGLDLKSAVVLISAFQAIPCLLLFFLEPQLLGPTALPVVVIVLTTVFAKPAFVRLVDRRNYSIQTTCNIDYRKLDER